ncbi:MAG: ATP-grasp domain-containing protein [Vicinamibacterales bacterium]
MSSLNVLITAGSRRVALVNGFRAALARFGGGRVVVTDVNPLSPAVHVADRAYAVPLSSDAGYIDEILRVALAERVRLVVPTIDDELTAFAEARPRFEAAGIRVAVSYPATTALCNDKLALCRTLVSRGVAAASSWRPQELPETIGYPLFVKPNIGRGGVGAYPIRTRRELDFFVDYVDDAIVQEYLDGPEFTLDMLCSFSGEALAIVPRERVVIRAGVIDRGRTVRDPALLALGRQCAAVLPFAGPVNIQCRVVQGTPVVFEINPRFSGGIALTLAAGVDMPRLLLELVLGFRVPPAIGQFKENLWMTNYEASVFVEQRHVRLTVLPPTRIAEVA